MQHKPERVLQSQARLNRSNIRKTPEVWRVWSVCVQQTAGYDRETDTIYVSTIAKQAGVARQTASRTLLRFDAEGVFIWRPAKRGSKGISELSLPPLDVTREPVEPRGVTRTDPCRNTTKTPLALGTDSVEEASGLTGQPDHCRWVGCSEPVVPGHPLCRTHKAEWDQGVF
jgi:hypothetical protein